MVVVGLLSFFILLTAGLVFSEIFKRLDLPYVLALIVAGIVIGPVFGIMQVDDTVSLMGTVGLVFLMFMAGSHVKMDSFRKIGYDIFMLAMLNGIVPFLTGFVIGQAFGYGLFTSLILGTTFISSSIAIIVPSLQSSKLIDTRLGRTILSSTVMEDVSSLLLLAVILQSFRQQTPLPLPIYIPTIILLLVVLKAVIPRIEKKYYAKKRGKDLFESELRFIFTVLLASVVLFEFLGMHSIVAGFIIGIFLSDTIKGKIEDKIHVISYGFFIPIFFLVLGMQTDIFVFQSMSNIFLLYAVVIGLFASKIASGWVGGRLLKFSSGESLLIGISTTPQMSTTLAVAYAALAFGLLNQELISTLVMLSVITVIVSPAAMRLLTRRIPAQKKQPHP
jgi:Kef-type K+ transport system membrane component KefB